MEKGSLNEESWIEVHLEKCLFRGASAKPFWSGAYSFLSATVLPDTGVTLGIYTCVWDLE